MPEIVEAQMLVDGLQPIIGEIILKVEKLGDNNIIKNPDALNLVEGKKIVDVIRFGKRPVICLENEIMLDVFLSMTGTFGLDHEPKYPRLLFELSNWHKLYYADMRKWGRISIMTREYHRARVQAQTGYDTLFTGDGVAASISWMFSKIWQAHEDHINDEEYDLKWLMMDDRYLVGLGNIYSQEILFDAGLRPDRPLYTLSQQQCADLAGYIRKHIDDAYKLGGLSVSNYTHADGTLGRASDLNHVYRRKTCKRCGETVLKIEQGGRSSYYCPACQE